jgi:hypothetical protein
MRNERILVIGDTHFPAHHRDTFAFLAALKKEFNPTRVVHIGDEADWHALSYHEKHVELPSAGDEMGAARRLLKRLEEMFPVMDLIESNHGSLPFRKAKTAGIPRATMRSYQEMWKTPKWAWHFKLDLRLPNSEWVQFYHGEAGTAYTRMQRTGTNTVHGHRHTEQYVMSARLPGNRLVWSAQTGCLADFNHLALSYGKTNVQASNLGSLVIIDSVPRNMFMTLKKSGRWTGRL